MNQTGNQLYKTNEELIQNTFLTLLKEKQISQITIREICDMAKVNRSTFYRHYEDIYALMHSIEKEIFTEFLEEFSTESHFNQCISQDHLAGMLRHIKKHSIFYYAYLTSNNQKLTEGNQTFLWEEYFVSMFQSYGVTNERHMLYYFQFFKAGLLSCVKKWLEDGCPESPDELASLIWNYSKHGKTI